MPMDLADLELLDAVANRGSFTAAGAQLRMSQPSVSARIAAIERAVGVALFRRESSGARLTGAGQRYLGYVRRSLALLDEGRRAAGAERGELNWRVGVPASYAAALAPILGAAARSCGLALTIRSAHNRELRAEIADARLDLAVVTPGARDVGSAGRHLLDTPVVAVRAPSPVRATRYAVHDWGEGADALTSELLGRGIARTELFVVSPATTALALALNDGYCAVVPRVTASAELASGRLVPAELGLPRVSASLEWVYAGNRVEDERMHAFLAAARAPVRRALAVR
jgi:DNA-binding transcriptional LysR family regulator